MALTDEDLDDLLGAASPSEPRWFLGMRLRGEEERVASLYSRAPLSLQDLPCAYPADGPPLALKHRPGLQADFRYAVSRPQLRYCASELAGITRALERHPNLKYVLYAGAPPGPRVGFLAEAFPGLEFHVGEWAAKAGEWAAKADEWEAKAGEWAAKGGDTILIANARSGDLSQAEFEKETLVNMELQVRWWRRVRPAAALLKFRLSSGVARGPVAYPAGEVLLQPFGDEGSAEASLLVWAGAEDKSYDPARYEDYFYWLNNFVREWATFEHGFALTRLDGVCRCFDCALLVETARRAVGPETLRDFGGDPDSAAAYLIGRMVAATGQRLLCAAHGERAGELMCDKRADLARRYGARPRVPEARPRAPEAQPRAPEDQKEPKKKTIVIKPITVSLPPVK